TQHIPTALVPDDEVDVLLRDVRVPDQHVLAEADVGPENGEGQHELTHDVVMLFINHLEVPLCLQCCDNQHEERHRAARCTSEEIDAPHGGKPVIVQAH